MKKVTFALAIILAVVFCPDASALTNVTSCGELQNITLNLSADYQLMNDIDCSGFDWTPISLFSGNFEGNGYTIANLTIDDKDSYVGMFEISEANFTNMNLDNITVYGNLTAESFVGILTGIQQYGKIENISIINSHIEGYMTVGGLIGGIYYTSVENVTADNVFVTGSSKVGGLIGWGEQEYNGSNLHVTNSIINSTGHAGGISGGTWDSLTNIDNADIDNVTIVCTESIEYPGESTCGGLIGQYWATLTDSYVNNSAVSGDSVAIGGLIGSIDNSNVHDVFVTNTVVSGNESSAGVIGSVGSSSSVYNIYSENVTVTGNTYGAGAIFGKLFGDAYNIHSEYSSVTCSGFACGGLIGGIQGGGLTDSYVVNVTVNGLDSGAGGAVGEIANTATGMIDNLTAYNVTVTGTNWLGGLIGRNYYPISNVFVYDSYVYSDSGERIGGISGECASNMTEGIVQNSVIYGNNQKIGGAAGYLNGWDDNVYYYMTNVNVTDSNITGSAYTGGLVGEADYGVIIDSYSVNNTADYNESVQGYAISLGFGATFDARLSNVKISGGTLYGGRTRIGGMVGRWYDTGGYYTSSVKHGYIEKSSVSDITIILKNNTGSASTQPMRAGCLLGSAESEDVMVINTSYAQCDIISYKSDFSPSYYGGLIGEVIPYYGITINISDTYAIANVTGTEAGDNLAGFIGGIESSSAPTVNIKNSYSVASITNGENATAFTYVVTPSTVTLNCSDNFYNEEVVGISDVSDCATGKTTEAMIQQSTYTGWDFNNIWTNSLYYQFTYPYFQWQTDNIPYVSGYFNSFNITSPKNASTVESSYVYINITAGYFIRNATLNYQYGSIDVNVTMFNLSLADGSINYYYNVTGVTHSPFTFSIYYNDTAANTLNRSEIRIVYPFFCGVVLNSYSYINMSKDLSCVSYAVVVDGNYINISGNSHSIEGSRSLSVSDLSGRSYFNLENVILQNGTTYNGYQEGMGKVANSIWRNVTLYTYNNGATRERLSLDSTAVYDSHFYGSFIMDASYSFSFYSSIFDSTNTVDDAVIYQTRYSGDNQYKVYDSIFYGGAGMFGDSAYFENVTIFGRQHSRDNFGITHACMRIVSPGYYPNAYNSSFNDCEYAIYSSPFTPSILHAAGSFFNSTFGWKGTKGVSDSDITYGENNYIASISLGGSGTQNGLTVTAACSDYSSVSYAQILRQNCDSKVITDSSVRTVSFDSNSDNNTVAGSTIDYLFDWGGSNNTIADSTITQYANFSSAANFSFINTTVLAINDINNNSNYSVSWYAIYNVQYENRTAATSDITIKDSNDAIRYTATNVSSGVSEALAEYYHTPSVTYNYEPYTAIYSVPQGFAAEAVQFNFSSNANINLTLYPIQFVADTPANKSTVEANSFIVNVTTNASFDSCKLNYTVAGSNYLVSMTKQSNYCYYNLTGITHSPVTFHAEINSSGSIYSSEIRTVYPFFCGILVSDSSYWTLTQDYMCSGHVFPSNMPSGKTISIDGQGHILNCTDTSYGTFYSFSDSYDVIIYNTTIANGLRGVAEPNVFLNVSYSNYYTVNYGKSRDFMYHRYRGFYIQHSNVTGYFSSNGNPVIYNWTNNHFMNTGSYLFYHLSTGNTPSTYYFADNIFDTGPLGTDYYLNQIRGYTYFYNNIFNDSDDTSDCITIGQAYLSGYYRLYLRIVNNTFNGCYKGIDILSIGTYQNVITDNNTWNVPIAWSGYDISSETDNFTNNNYIVSISNGANGTQNGLSVTASCSDFSSTSSYAQILRQSCDSKQITNSTVRTVSFDSASDNNNVTSSTIDYLFDWGGSNNTINNTQVNQYINLSSTVNMTLVNVSKTFSSVQEEANERQFLYTWYNSANAYDGDNSTSTKTGHPYSTIYFNYSKPAVAKTAIWQIKEGGILISERTFVIPEICMSYPDNKIKVGVTSSEYGVENGYLNLHGTVSNPNHGFAYFCFINETYVQQLGYSYYANHYFYEERMYFQGKLPIEINKVSGTPTYSVQYYVHLNMSDSLTGEEIDGVNYNITDNEGNLVKAGIFNNDTQVFAVEQYYYNGTQQLNRSPYTITGTNGVNINSTTFNVSDEDVYVHLEIPADTSPPVCNLLSPFSTEHTSDNTTTFTWSCSDQTAVDTSQIQIANDSAFTDILYDYNTTNSTYTIAAPGLPDNGEAEYYYWRIRANDTIGYLSNWTANQTFVIDTVNPDVVWYNWSLINNTVTGQAVQTLNVSVWNHWLGATNLTVWNVSEDITYNNLTENISSPIGYVHDTITLDEFVNRVEVCAYDTLASSPKIKDKVTLVQDSSNSNAYITKILMTGKEYTRTFAILNAAGKPVAKNSINLQEINQWIDDGKHLKTKWFVFNPPSGWTAVIHLGDSDTAYRVVSDRGVTRVVDKDYTLYWKFDDLIQAGYDVQFQQDGDAVDVLVTQGNATSQHGIFELDPIVGGLHQTCESMYVEADFTAPNVTLYSPLNTTYNQSYNIAINWNATDRNLESVWYTVYNLSDTEVVSKTYLTSNSTISMPVSGQFYVVLSANDSGSNEVNVTRYFSIFDYETALSVVDGIVDVGVYEQLNLTVDVAASGQINYTPIYYTQGNYTVYNSTGDVIQTAEDYTHISFFGYQSQSPYYILHRGMLVEEIDTSEQICPPGYNKYEYYCARFVSSGDWWQYYWKMYLKSYDDAVNDYLVEYNVSKLRFTDWDYKTSTYFALDDDNTGISASDTDPITFSISASRSMTAATRVFTVNYGFGSSAVSGGGGGGGGAPPKEIVKTFETDIPDDGLSFTMQPGDSSVQQFLVTNLVNYDLKNFTIWIESKQTSQWITFVSGNSRYAKVVTILPEKSPLDPGYAYITYEIDVPDEFQIGTFEFMLFLADDAGYQKAYPIYVTVISPEVATITGMFLSPDWPRFPKAIGAIEGIPLVFWVMLLGGSFGFILARRKTR